MNSSFKNVIKKRITLISVVVILVIGITMSVATVDTGSRGIVLRFGEAVRVLEPGLSFKIPFMETVTMMEVREQYQEDVFSVSSKDIQTIKVRLNVQYAITGDVLELFNNFGIYFKSRLLDPRISENVNAVVARYTIEEFIEKRSLLAQELLKELQDDFSSYGFTVSAASIIEHDFSEEFDKSIEAKKIAEQEALRSKNILERIKYEAQAEIEKAQGIAEANRVVQTSLTDILIKQKMIDKWDGKLPLYQGGGEDAFMLNLSAK